MNYQIIPPPAKLAGYIRFFWILESNTPYLHRSMPDGCAELIFHYHGVFDELLENEKKGKSFVSGIHGPSKNFRRFLINSSFGIFGVYIYPFAIPRIFSIPASEVSNQMPDLNELMGKEGQVLEERMMMAKNNMERVGIISSFIERRLEKSTEHPTNISSAVHNILNANGLVSIPALAANSCLSVRQFERKFKEYSGFSPKLYTRIIRFQTAMSQYGSTSKTLTEIAYDCGYYDQSHFINEFKEFSGYSPATYFSGKAEGLAWRDSEMS